MQIKDYRLCESIWTPVTFQSFRSPTEPALRAVKSPRSSPFSAAAAAAVTRGTLTRTKERSAAGGASEECGVRRRRGGIQSTVTPSTLITTPQTMTLNYYTYSLKHLLVFDQKCIVINEICCITPRTMNVLRTNWISNVFNRTFSQSYLALGYRCSQNVSTKAKACLYISY